MKLTEQNETGNTGIAGTDDGCGLEQAGGRVGLVSLGCPKNLIDSERMLGQIAAGNPVVSDLEDADVVVVNTCCFVAEAKQESIDTILEMLERKRRGELQRVIVTGCLAQRYPEELRRELPEVDALVGVTSEDQVAPLIAELAPPSGKRSTLRKLPMAREGQQEPSPEEGLADDRPGPRVFWQDPSRPFEAETSRLRLTPKHYAYVRVAEGCDHACTFCAIPGFRGRFRSKPEAAVLTEALELARDGARELLLIAEDTNQYGMDRRDGTSLARLLPQLAAIDGVAWLRILYAYPAYFSDELIDAIATTPEVCKYIDIPLQHIADPVLRRMRRPSRQQTEALLNKLRERIPGLTLRTTMICGFPGETEADHRELLEFVHSFGFDRLGAFAYSTEDGTVAGSFEEQVPEEVRERRRDEVMVAQQEVAFARNQARIGTSVRCIVDRVEAAEEIKGATGGGRGEVYHGRTEGDAPEIDGAIRFRVSEQAGGASSLQPGALVTVHVTSASGYDLEGEIAAHE
jgi:ribosomal protein S12 methylthiotransferase